MLEQSQRGSQDPHGELGSPLSRKRPASEVYLIERRRLDDSVWLVGWCGARLRNSSPIWILAAVEASSGQCRVLRAHDSRNARWVVDDLDSALRAKNCILQVIYVSDSDPTLGGKLLENWALFHRVMLMYVPWRRPRSGDALDTCARAVQSDVLERVRTNTLVQLNKELAKYRLARR